MKVARVFTTAGASPYEGIAFRTATSEIRNPDGSVVFRLDDIEVPSAWSQVAVDVLAQKYFRKAGIAARLAAVDEPGVPAWLQRRRPDAAALEAPAEDERYGGETSARQVFDRLAGTWTWWGWKGGYFDSEDDARAFFDELRFMLASQYAAPNSPQWFNTGLNWAYGIDGPAQGHYFADDADRRGQALDLGLRAAAAARLLHPEHPGRPGQPGRHHGPLGARGAAVQVRLGHRHQLLEPARRERAALRRRQVVRPDELPQDRRPRRRRDQVRRHHAARRQDGRGRRRPSRHRELRRLEGARGAEGRGAGRGLEAARTPPERDPHRLPRRRPRRRGALQPPRTTPRSSRRSAPRARCCCPRARSSRRSSTPARATPGSRSRPTSTDWDSEAYVTVAGQNSNNSVRVTGEFLERVLEDREWQLIRRTDGKVATHAAGARAVGPDRARRLGAAPIPACSTTPRSTSGTPAPPPAGSTRPTRARSTCSSTTRRAISPRST